MVGCDSIIMDHCGVGCLGYLLYKGAILAADDKELVLGTSMNLTKQQAQASTTHSSMGF